MSHRWLAGLGLGLARDWQEVSKSWDLKREKMIPFVEASKAFPGPDLLHDVTCTPVFVVGVISLQSSPHNLVWVSDASREHLAHSTEGEEVHVGKLVLSTSCDAKIVLQLLIGHELNCAMRDAEQRWYQTTIETTHTFGRPKMLRTMAY